MDVSCSHTPYSVEAAAPDPALVAGAGAHRADVDVQLLAELVVTAAGDCTLCEARLLGRVVGDDTTWGRLIEWAFETCADERGLLPQQMTSPQAPGSGGEAFRSLAATFLFLGANRRYEHWAALSVPDRWAAARTALGYLVGQRVAATYPAHLTCRGAVSPSR